MIFNHLRRTTATLSQFHNISTRNFTATAAIMGVTKTILKEGNGAIPKNGDKVTIEYTGFLKDESKPGNKGEK